MARVLMNCWFFLRTAHLTTAAKFAKKIHVESRESLAQRSAQLFCSARTIRARALLNCGCLAVSRTANLRDDNNSPIFLLG